MPALQPQVPSQAGERAPRLSERRPAARDLAGGTAGKLGGFLLAITFAAGSFQDDMRLIDSWGQICGSLYD